MSDDNFLKIYFKESQAFSNAANIGELLKSGQAEHLPVQPVYEFVSKLTPDQVGELIPYLTDEMKQVILDLDLWKKDNINPANFGFWIESFEKCPDLDSKEKFVQDPQFGLYLKSIFDISSFDVENPLYPDHDNYFLTEDNQLMFEYGEDFAYVNEVKSLLQILYSLLGVENAYAYLFKVLVNSYLLFQESEYEDKVERLRDYGFVDYYEALKLKAAFLNLSQIDKFIEGKLAATGGIDWIGKAQVLTQKFLVGFKDKMDLLYDDLNQVEDNKRSDFLRFNFTRLVNAGLSLQNEVNPTTISNKKVGDEIKFYLNFGISYIQKIKKDQKLIIFDKFDFFEVYKVGYSLVSILQNKVKKEFNRYQKMQEKQFWGEQLEENLNSPFKNQDEFECLISGENKNKRDYYNEWSEQVQFALSALPFCQQFFQTLNDLVDESKISSHNYLNYKVEEIDFEVLLLSSFANFSLGHFENGERKKMAVSSEDLLKFWGMYFATKEDKTVLDQKVILPEIQKYVENFGFSKIPMFPFYMIKLCRSHLEGYSLAELEKDSNGFRYVGGPIIYAEEK